VTVTGGKLDVNASIDTTGLATSAKQDTGNTSIGNVDTKIGEVQATPTANTVLGRLKDILTGIVLSAGTNIIGAVKRDVINYTSIRKYYTNAGAVTDGIIWSPAAGKKWVITDIIINVSADRVSITGTATSRLDMGNGTWTLYGGFTGQTSWDATTVTLLTFNANGSTIQTGNANVTETFKGGGLTYNNITVRSGGSSSILIFTGSNNIQGTLTINAPKTVKFTAGTTTKFSKMVAIGRLGNRITITSDTSFQHYLYNTTGVDDIFEWCDISNSKVIGNKFTAFTEKGNVDRRNNAGWVFYKPNKWTSMVSSTISNIFMTCNKGWW